ncbi:MAG: methionyl-tRNA formyltransferase [Leptospiraceae bacterium]|nr:methionyl-tRNA formyltransferase [Leptospiraceae bacterium]
MTKVAFWGTPGIAAGLLNLLLKDEFFSVCYVVTQPDKPRSVRGREVLPSPVKKAAQIAGIPVFSPTSLKKEKQTVLDANTSDPVDFHVVLAYGKILPPEILDMTPGRMVNFHASLLPLLRGAAPIEFALLQGFTETGWTLQKIIPELDAGDILAQTKVPILKTDTRETLYEKLTDDLQLNALPVLKKFSQGELKAVPQDAQQATFCGKISTQMGLIDWSHSAGQILNLSRALGKSPGVYSFFRGKKIKLAFHLDKNIANISGTPGEILQIDRESMLVATGQSGVYVQQCQVEGGRSLAANDFCNGYHPKIGEKFG